MENFSDYSDSERIHNLLNGSNSKIDKIACLMRQILEMVNPNANDEIIQKTPIRFAKSILEFTKGYEENNLTDQIIDSTYDSEKYNDIIIIKDISFSSLCEHHLLPFFGTCDIGYIPKDKILGLSKFPRLVESLSRKMHIQERLTTEIADSINNYLNPEGVIVILRCVHSCMSFRGIKSHNANTTTIYREGCFRNNEFTDRFFNLINID